MKVHIVAETDVESFDIKKIFSNIETANKYKQKLEQEHLEGIKTMLEEAKKENNEFKIKTWLRHLYDTKYGEFIGTHVDVLTYEVDES